MKYIITESHNTKYFEFLKKLNRKVGKELDFEIIKVTTLDEMPNFVLETFHADKKMWKDYLDVSPIYVIKQNEDYFLVQKRGSKFQISDSKDRPMSEFSLLSRLDIGVFGAYLEKLLGIEE